MPIKKIAELPPRERRCRHPDHDPPTMICLPPGVYEHERPECGRKIQFNVHGSSMRAKAASCGVLQPLVVPKWYVGTTHENRSFPSKVPPL